MKIKKLLIVTGAVLSAFALGLKPAQAHLGHSLLNDPLPAVPPFVEPLTLGNIFYGNPLSLGNDQVRTFVTTS